MKKNFITGFIIGALVFGVAGVLATNYTVVENQFPVKFNNKEVNIEGYNINDSTYFKLRDIADAVGGFDVDFKNNTILLSTEDSKPIEETLTVATNAVFPPFEFISVNGEIDGIDIAIAKRIAEETGKELEIRDMEFDGVITSVARGMTDIAMAGITVTEDRQNVVDFSEPYYTISQIILVNADNTDIITAEELKNGKTVGVILNYVGDYCVTSELNISDENIVRHDSARTLAQAVKDGSIDAFVFDYTEGVQLAEEYGLKIIEDTEAFEKEEYAIAVPKGNTEMLKTVNNIISQMKASGELDYIISDYIK